VVFFNGRGKNIGHLIDFNDTLWEETEILTEPQMRILQYAGKWKML